MNKISILALIIAVIALGGYVFPHVAGSGLLGGVTNYDEVDATAIKIGGTNGSRVGPIIATTCNFIGSDSSQTASTTLAYDCAITGVVSGDIVEARLASSTPRGGSSSWAISAAMASTTSGYVTFLLTNNGPAAVPSATSVGSSTQVVIYHPVSSVPGI